MSAEVAQVEVDVRGLRCPAPVIRAARAAADAADGTLLLVLATDPAAEPDLGAWCRLRGHDLLDQRWAEDVLLTRVRVRRTAQAAPP